MEDKPIDTSTLCRDQGMWKDFQESYFWRFFLGELNERYNLVLQKLIDGGDKFWTDDNMRGRLSELDYLRTLPDMVIADIELQLQQHKEKEDGKRESGPDSPDE